MSGEGPDLSPGPVLCNLGTGMEAPHDPLQGSGDDGEEEAPRSSWLPPDDRLWRHPSEVRVNPAPLIVPVARRRLRQRLVGSFASVAAVSVASGLTGALLCAGLLWVAGDLGPKVTNLYKVVGTSPVRPVSVGAATASIPDVVEPWVVGLSVTGAAGPAYGSGVVVYSGGNISYALTDEALFAEAGGGPQVQVTNYAGVTRPGQLVLLDPGDGIAVVKLGWATRSTALLGTAASLGTGEQVFAVGSTWASATSQGSYYAAGTITDQESYVQPDNSSAGMFSMLVAAINVDPSAAGGPLVDANGYVLGITNPVSAQLQKPDLSYVTPIDTAMADVDELVRYGHITPHGWMGVLEATDITGPGAAQMGLQGGVQVDALVPGSPLAKAGLQVGDIITAIDHSPTSSVGALIFLMADAQPGVGALVNWAHQGHREGAYVTMVAEPATVGSS